MGLDPQGGRPTLMLVRDTADQAVRDIHAALEDLEDLLNFLSMPDSALMDPMVAQQLTDWGPWGPAGPPETLDPSAARRLARQYAAKGASSLLQRLHKLLYLLENCLAIVLLHYIQVSNDTLDIFLPSMHCESVLGSGIQVDVAVAECALVHIPVEWEFSLWATQYPEGMTYTGILTNSCTWCVLCLANQPCMAGEGACDNAHASLTCVALYCCSACLVLIVVLVMLVVPWTMT